MTELALRRLAIKRRRRGPLEKFWFFAMCFDACLTTMNVWFFTQSDDDWHRPWYLFGIMLCSWYTVDSYRRWKAARENGW